MSTAKNTLIALLALTTVGGAIVSWRQYQELAELRAAALTADERSKLQKKIWDLQKANRELTEKLAAEAASKPENEAADGAALRGGTEESPRMRGGPRRGEQFAAMRELMQKPEVQAILNSAQKALIDARYAALFKNLNLAPEQAQKLTQLLAERQNAVQDVFAAAREQGVNPRTDPAGFQKLVADAESSVNDSIKSLLGDSGYSDLTNYEQTLPQRNLVNVLQQRLNSSDAPLTSSQADQLVQILATNAPTRATEGLPPGVGMGGGPAGRLAAVTGGFGGGVSAVAGPGAAPITPEAVAQAGTVLNSTQLSALQQLQQQQQNMQQLQQMMRSTWQQSNAQAPATGGANQGAVPPAPRGKGPG